MKIKSFISGFLCATVICAGSIVGLASTGTQTLSAAYNNIKISLNGKTLTPTDANGKSVEPFIVNGTTYLPVRAVASALGVNVGWDGNTNTVVLTDSGNSSTGSSTPVATTAPSSNNSTTNVMGQGIAPNTVVFNKSGLKVTYTGMKHGKYSFNNEWYDTYEFKIENTSSSVTYMVTSDSLTVDGIKCPTALIEKVAPGETSYETMTLSQSTLEEYTHLTSYNVIRQRLEVYNANDFSESSMYSDYFKLSR